MLGNKYVCFMRKDDREKILEAQRRRREAWSKRMHGEAHVGIDPDKAEGSKYGMKVEETEEVIQPRKQVKAKTRAELADED
jgi:hypothetical protein